MATETEPAVKEPLVVKLAQVMAEIHRIPKRGKNDFHGYSYATESDITEAIRAELSKRHVMILPRVTGKDIQQTTSEKGKAGLLAYVDMTFTLIDGESGEALECPWLGVGEDRGDKAVYKAFTGATKYFLLKLFLIPTGDDPEKDARKPKGKADDAGMEEPPLPDPSSDAGVILAVADALSQVTGTPIGRVIVAASSFTKDGKTRSFDDPRRVSSVKWLKATREKLERELQEKGAKAAVGDTPLPF